MDKIRDQIRKVFDDLTVSQKKVAKFLLKEPARIALHAAKDVGIWTGTSETSVFRFSIAIGYSGYSMLQEEIRKALLQDRKTENPLNQLASTDNIPTELAAFMAYTSNQNDQYLKQTVSGIRHEAMENTARLIMAASKIIVIGLRASYAPAHWLAYTLNIIRGNTLLYQGGVGDANYLLAELDQDSLVIALSFPMYMKETVEFVTAAKMRSAKIVAITDSELSPIGILADECHQVQSAEPVTLKGMPVIFSLLNMITSLVTVRDTNRVQKRIKEYNSIGKQGFYYVEGQEDTE